MNIFDEWRIYPVNLPQRHGAHLDSQRKIYSVYHSVLRASVVIFFKVSIMIFHYVVLSSEWSEDSFQSDSPEVKF